MSVVPGQVKIYMYTIECIIKKDVCLQYEQLGLGPI